jgi:hypothetical protein
MITYILYALCIGQVVSYSLNGTVDCPTGFIQWSCVNQTITTQKSDLTISWLSVWLSLGIGICGWVLALSLCIVALCVYKRKNQYKY